MKISKEQGQALKDAVDTLPTVATDIDGMPHVVRLDELFNAIDDMTDTEQQDISPEMLYLAREAEKEVESGDDPYINDIKDVLLGKIIDTCHDCLFSDLSPNFTNAMPYIIACCLQIARQEKLIPEGE